MLVPLPIICLVPAKGSLTALPPIQSQVWTQRSWLVATDPSCLLPLGGCVGRGGGVWFCFPLDCQSGLPFILFTLQPHPCNPTSEGELDSPLHLCWVEMNEGSQVVRTKCNIWQQPHLLSLNGLLLSSNRLHAFPISREHQWPCRPSRGSRHHSPVLLPSLTTFPQSTLPSDSSWLGQFPEFIIYLCCSPPLLWTLRSVPLPIAFLLAPVFHSGLSLSTLPARIGQDLLMKVPLHSGGPLSINGLWKQILSDFRESKCLTCT